MTPNELASIIASHAGWLRAEHGASRANLGMRELSGFDFSGVELRDSKFTGAGRSLERTGLCRIPC